MSKIQFVALTQKGTIMSVDMKTEKGITPFTLKEFDAVTGTYLKRFEEKNPDTGISEKNGQLIIARPVSSTPYIIPTGKYLVGQSLVTASNGVQYNVYKVNVEAQVVPTTEPY